MGLMFRLLNSKTMSTRKSRAAATLAISSSFDFLFFLGWSTANTGSKFRISSCDNSSGVSHFLQFTHTLCLWLTFWQGINIPCQIGQGILFLFRFICQLIFHFFHANCLVICLFICFISFVPMWNLVPECKTAKIPYYWPPTLLGHL